MDDTNNASAHVVGEMPSLVQRGLVYLIGLVLLLSLVWLYAGKASVIVNARGRIVPEGDVVSVQALQGGVVNAVLAKAGDRLPAGAPVLKLDLAESGMSVTELQQKRDGQQDQLTRLKATTRLIDAILANPDTALQGTRQTVIATVGKTTELVNQLEDAKGKVDGAKGAIAGWPGRKAQMQREV